MRINWFGLVCGISLVFVSGCKPNADITAASKTGEIKEAGEVSGTDSVQIARNTKIVTGEPLSSPSVSTVEEDAAATADDKPGAVAVKMGY